MIRTVDLFLSTTLIFLLMPLMCFICVGIVLSDGWPVLFRQVRIGLNGEPFTILKFRTMRVSEPDNIILQAHQEENRIFSFGAFLRRHYLDELSQLFNVLKGDMSLVGPRPHEAGQDERFAKIIPGYKLRQTIKPGMTGLAQVRGLSGPILDEDIIRKRVKLDIELASKMSSQIYVQILFQTFVLLIKKTKKISV
ncbi:sugar transferase [Alphaproteobacteria bacterium]|nr:sugar transferase [Alphaproteobacteria bacterium]